MLFRFSLYGFLKNQQYYDAFLILAFRDKGLSFVMIGLLIGFREVCINLMEVPTGAIADVIGRRRSMVFSFLAYIVAFAVFGLSRQTIWLFAAMFLFSVAEAFRTGTHKAMIFDWLQRQGRSGEKTRVYGFTRSWSKIGSTLSVVVAAVLVFTVLDYSLVFLACIGPYVLNVANLLTYPSWLDGPRRGAGVGEIVRVLLDSVRRSVRSRPLRRLLAESMGFGGVFKAGKDYLQPVLQAMPLALPILLSLEGRQRTAVIVGAVYVLLHITSSYASRHADALARHAGSERAAARQIWAMAIGVFALMTGGLLAGLPGLAAGAFVALAVIQNFWRPVLISRFAEHAEAENMATMLSIESQVRSFTAAVIAPLLGLAVDLMPSELRFLPVGLLGLAVATGMFVTSKARRA